jgi:hypothetical protein
MKARAVLFLIFLTTAGMAGSLYYVLKHSAQFTEQAAHQMKALWVQNSPAQMGPYEIQGESVLVVLPQQAQDWNLSLEGEKLMLKPLKIEFPTAPGNSKPPSEAAQAEAWKLAQVEIRNLAIKVLKLQKSPEDVIIQAP